LDENGDGYISADEFHKVFAEFNINEHIAGDVIAALDRDDDGVISITEFKRALTPKHTQNLPRAYGLSID